MHDWLQTPAGRYLLEWEREWVDAAVVDMFGYHALQLGVPELDGLQANRMPHRWLACEQPSVDVDPALTKRAAVFCDYAALPFPANSLDLVLMPHSLEFSADPHTALREVERVLVPEGRVLICGLNPASLWGLQQRRGHLYQKWVLANCSYRMVGNSLATGACEIGCDSWGLRLSWVSLVAIAPA